jgi:hypothetical protein
MGSQELEEEFMNLLLVGRRTKAKTLLSETSYRDKKLYDELSINRIVEIV